MNGGIDGTSMVVCDICSKLFFWNNTLLLENLKIKIKLVCVECEKKMYDDTLMVKTYILKSGSVRVSGK
jgi:hypothetical protein